MVRIEAETVFSATSNGQVWLAEIPAQQDPWRDRWHLPVGARLRTAGAAHRAFVLQTGRATEIVATTGLWGGSGGMLKRYWRQVPVDEARERLHGQLAGGEIERAEMFYRPRFHDYLWPVDSQWGVPLVEQQVLDIVGAVSA